VKRRRRTGAPRKRGRSRTAATAEDLDPVWKALSDATRREILDLLRDGPRTTTEIVERFPQLSRFGVMKHIEVLRCAGLINTRDEGRSRVNSLNAVPIQQIHERWVSRYAAYWAGMLIDLKETIEGPARPTQRRVRKRSQSDEYR
jgi:DNA-binding transcriptional ArsR family regulator